MDKKKTNNNPFTMRDEIILIEHDDVIKCPSLGILELIKEKYTDDLKGLIDIPKIQRMDFNNLQRLCIERPTKNILDYLKLTDFNTGDIYDELYKSDKSIYMGIPLMVMGSSIYILSPQKFTKGIYIFSEEYDEKIEYNIYENFSDLPNVYYVAGDLKEIIQSIPKPTMYIFSDIEHVQTLINENKIEYTEIMVAQYGYNYEVKNGILQIKGDYDKLMPELLFKIASFSPLKMDKSFYTID